MDDEASISLDGKTLTNLRVVDLKQELERRGLSKSGSKKDLVKRLKQQLEFEKLCEDRKSTGDCDLKLELDAVTEQNEFVQQYLAQQQKIYAEQKEVKRLIELEEIQKSGDEIESCDSKLEDDAHIQNSEGKIIDSSEFKEQSQNECNEKSVLVLEEIVEQNTTESTSPKHSEDQVHITVLHQDSSLDKRCRSSFKKSPISDMERPAQFSTVSNVPYSLADIQLPDSPGNRLMKSVAKAKISDESRVEPHSVQNSDCLDVTKPKQILNYDSHEMSSNGISSTQNLIPISGDEVASDERSKESEVATDSKGPSHSEDMVQSDITTLSEEIHEKNKEIVSVKQFANESNDTVTAEISVCGQEVDPENETAQDDLSQSDCFKTINETEQKLDSPDQPAEVDCGTKSIKPQDSDTEKSSESDGEQSSSTRSGKHLPSRDSCEKNSPSSRSHSSDSSSGSSESSSERESYVKHHEDPKSRSHSSNESKKSETLICDGPVEKDASKKIAQSPKNEPPKQRLKIKRNNIVKIGSSTDSVSEKNPDNQVSSEKESRSSLVEADISPEVQIQDSIEKPSKIAEPLHVRITHRKISISSRKLNRKSVDEDKVDEPGCKKSRWGSYTSSLPKASISISSDSLKNLIPDFKLISGPISSNDIEEVLAPISPDELTSAVKETKHTNFPVTKDLAVEEVMDTLPNNQALNSRKEFESEQLPLKCSSPQGPVSKIIFIQNLVRPFTLLQLKELLKQTGTIVEENFWIDKIKSKCFVMYETEEESLKTRSALNGTRWPSSNPKILSAEFATQEELDFHKNVSEGPKTLPPALVPIHTEIFETRTVLPIEDHKKKEKDRRKEKERTKPLPPVREWDKDKLTQESPDRERVNKESERVKNLEKKEKKDTKRRPNEDTPAKLLDDLFQKTKSSPCIYWLPLTEEQVKQREEDRRLRRLEREKRSQQQKEQEEAERRNRRARPGQKSREKENRRSQSRSPVARRR